MRPTLLLVAALAACGTPATTSQPAQLGAIGFDVPVGWHRTDTVRPGMVVAVWTPDDNERKETVTVIRTELSPVVAGGGHGRLVQLLEQAQTSLPEATRSEVRPISTGRGLVGARIEVDYVPPGLHDHYHRVHAVVVDGASLVHVLYTALRPDADLDAFHIVLNTLHHGQA
jgi:hypothetical protein